jgi:phage-related tail protein
MLTNEDIVKLSAVLATKEDIRGLEERVSKLEESHQRLITSVDKLAKAVKDLQIEYVAVLTKVNRMEEWIKKASVKLGIDFSF